MSLPAIFEDAFNLLCADKLGSGVHRTVYSCRLMENMVVKVEDNNGRHHRSFANVKEMDFWGDNVATSVAKWLAPCEYLSPDGRILLQRRVDPIPLGYELPDRLPAFLTDVKRENFGLLEGRLVCVDYAFVLLRPRLATRPAHWH